jgi:hypothetical protein
MFSKIIYNKGSFFSTYLPTFIFHLFVVIPPNLIGMRGYFIVFFYLHFIDKDVKHFLCICWLFVFIFGKMFIQVLSPFLNEVLCLHVIGECPFYILDSSPLSM